MIAVMDERRILAAEAEEVRLAITQAREAQVGWSHRPVAERAELIGSLRPLLAHAATELACVTASVNNRPLAEKLVSEVLPLLEAARFLEKNTARVLRSRRFGLAGRPLWLHGSSFVTQRKPYGVVLIVGPSNYPLFIPAVQMLHALAAGNAVVLKPAEAAAGPLTFLIDQVITRSGISTKLVQILPSSVEAARQAVRCGVDKAIFTGSSENGRDFLAKLALQNTPSVMELSGADAVFVRADADLQLAAKAIAFGFRLNAGETCMAPHAIVVHESVAPALTEMLGKLGVRPNGIFAVRTDAEALEVAFVDEHGLGAAVFSRNEKEARAFAHQLATGFVTINDLTVPTADPRFPFGGVRGSGFGVTRGAEGLLEMTYPQSVAVRRARFLPHLEEPREGDEELFASFASVVHSRGLGSRWQAFRRMLRAGRQRIRQAGAGK